MLHVPFSLESKRNQKVQDGLSRLKVNYVPLKELKCRVHAGWKGGVGGHHRLWSLHSIDFLYGSKLSLSPLLHQPKPIWKKVIANKKQPSLHNKKWAKQVRRLLSLLTFFSSRKKVKRTAFCKDVTAFGTKLRSVESFGTQYDTEFLSMFTLSVAVCYTNKLAMVVVANTTLAMPLVVLNARFTREMSLGETMACWNTKQPINATAPTQ